MWDVATSTAVATTASHGGPIALSPDGRMVAVTSAVPDLDDQSLVTLLDAETLDPIRTLRGHAGSLVEEIAFDGDGSRIATASLDGTVRVWDARTGDLLLSPPPEPSGVASVAFAQAGSQLVVVYADGRILVYPVALDDAIAVARSRVTRSLTDAECRRYLHLENCSSR